MWSYPSKDFITSDILRDLVWFRQALCCWSVASNEPLLQSSQGFSQFFHFCGKSLKVHGRYCQSPSERRKSSVRFFAESLFSDSQARHRHNVLGVHQSRPPVSVALAMAAFTAAIAPHVQPSEIIDLHASSSSGAAIINWALARNSSRCSLSTIVHGQHSQTTWTRFDAVLSAAMLNPSQQ